MIFPSGFCGGASTWSRRQSQDNHVHKDPICSMYGTFTYIWILTYMYGSNFMVNVFKSSINEAYGEDDSLLKKTMSWVICIVTHMTNLHCDGCKRLSHWRINRYIFRKNKMDARLEWMPKKHHHHLLSHVSSMAVSKWFRFFRHFAATTPLGFSHRRSNCIRKVSGDSTLVGGSKEPNLNELNVDSRHLSTCDWQTQHTIQKTAVKLNTSFYTALAQKQQRFKQRSKTEWQSLLLCNLPSLKLKKPWKSMVGRIYIPFGKAYFQGLCLFQGG